MMLWIEITFTFIILIIFAMAMVAVLGRKAMRPKSPIIERSHRHHEPVGDYEDDHLDRIGSRLVAHPEPEEGYVVLNGVKRKLEDCKNL